ncbi:MAG: hypothetical protein LBQ24_04510 [Candidatus Peribacteria bacterium]|nr:hypothetical protein [Candidatus Peribacteria bacterium]
MTTSSDSTCKSHFSDKKIANDFVAGILASIMFIITIIGTDKSIQIIHQIIHQNAREIIITNGLKFNLFHINCGSIIFQHITSVSIKREAINKVS